jgi:outer membrane protein TolC
MAKKFSLLLFLFQAFSAFSQNTLNDYLQAAVTNSPLFIETRNQIQSLTIDSTRIRAGFRPQVNFTSDNYYAPVFNGYGYDEIITNGGNYNALVGINYTLIGKNNLRNQYSSFDIQKKILEVNAKLGERDLKQAVTAQYITVYGEQQILSNIEKVLDVLGREDTLLKDIAEKGAYRQTDYLSFLVSYRQQQLSSDQQKLHAQNDLYLLNYLCGIVDTAYVILQDPSLSINQSISHDKATQYRQFDLDSMKLQNAFEQLRFNYRPKLSLLADAGYQTTFIYHAEKNFGASAGLKFSFPIYDGGLRKLQTGKFKFEEATRLAQAEFFKRQFTMKQLQLMQQLTKTDQLIEGAEGQLSISEALMKANEKLLQTGDVRVADYILSLAGYISLQSAIRQLQTDRMQLINQYNYLNY